MDTKEKNQDASRQPRPQQSGQKRPASAGQRAAEPRRSTPQKKPAAQTAQQRVSQQRASQPGTAQQRSAQPQNKPQSAPRQQAARQRPASQTSGSAQRTRQQRTAKQNPLQSFIAGLRRKWEKTSPQTEQAKRRQEQRAANAERKRKQAARNNTPAVIYTAPLPFNRNRLLIQLITVTAVVLALIMGLSIFFKVEVITVSGAEIYSAWAVREASGISEGDNLLTFGRARASGQITAKLPYVKSVRIGIKLPNTVNIEIEEMDVVYAIKAENGTWWLINSEGKVVEQTDGGTAGGYTKVLGVTLTDPKANEQGIATEDVPTETDESGAFIPPTVTGAQRLNAALQILKALEDNDIVGEAASVDVTRLEDIILWYGTRYQVNLGDTSRMDEKIACMNGSILQLSDYQTGVLDISFTIMPDQVVYTPFE